MKRARTSRPVLVAALVLAAAAGALHAHVTLVATTPERGASIDAAPPALRLRFSGMIEPRYTSVSLLAPDGGSIAIGDVVFVDGSDREFTASLPRLETPGTYTVRWRTAGADGHVLEGTWTFTLAPRDTALTDTADMAGAAPDPAGAPPAPAGASPHHGTVPQEHEGMFAGLGAGPVLARWLHFVALVLLAGAFAFRLLLLPRLRLADGGVRAGLQDRAWRTAAGATLLLAVAAVLRLWAQSAALHGGDHAWDASLLRLMLTGTAWGRGWLIQAALFGLLLAGLAVAHLTRPRDRTALLLAVPAALGLAAVPALTGHAAGTGGAALIVANDALHVLAAGAWLGTLAVLLLAAVPLIARRSPEPGSMTARAVESFSPLALVAASLVMITGVINALLHLRSLADVTGTGYGRTLLVKLALVGLVGLAGFINWRVVRPALRRGADPRRLRMSAGVELALALLVLLATAVLTGTPRP